jgi:hypothetical protein
MGKHLPFPWGDSVHSFIIIIADPRDPHTPPGLQRALWSAEMSFRKEDFLHFARTGASP